MEAYQDLVVSSREKSAAVQAMKDALKVMLYEIMPDEQIQSQRGYSWTDNDMETLIAGRKAIHRWVPNPQGLVQRLENEKALDTAGRAVSLAEMMLRRQGFDDLRSAGDDVIDGDVFSDAQKRVVERAWERFQDITQHGRN